MHKNSKKNVGKLTLREKMEFLMLRLEVEKRMQYGEVLSKNH